MYLLSPFFFIPEKKLLEGKLMWKSMLSLERGKRHGYVCLYKSNYFVACNQAVYNACQYEDTHGGTNDGGKHFNFINHP